VFETANTVEDELAGGATIEDVAQKLGLRVVKVDAMDSSGRKPDGSPVEGLIAPQQLAQAAFGLQEGSASSLTETPVGDYFIVRVDAITPAALRPLDSVRGEVVAAWQAEQRAQRAAKWAEDIAGRLRAGSTMQDIAALLPGVATDVTPALTRDGRERGQLPPALLEQLFTLSQGQVATAPTRDGQMVIRLQEIQNADPAAAGAQVAQLRQSVQQAMVGDLLAQFTEGLRQRYPVTINQTTIDTMFQRN
jgi:peptidyl-prolyl cis-trans isomerase D